MPRSTPAFFSRANVQSLVVTVSFIFCLRWSVASPYVVPTPSMEPSIKVGDRVLGNHLAYRLRMPFTNYVIAQWATPERGDIIIFKSQTEPNIDLVKRVVAVAGDEVAFRDGTLIVNGQAQPTTDEDGNRSVLADATDRPAHKHLYREDLNGHWHWIEHDVAQHNGGSGLPAFTQNWPLSGAAYRVPEGFVFASGDNRDNSSDSRVWGPVPIGDIYGKATRVIWSAFFDEKSGAPRVRIARFGASLYE